jgi:hypothetical protein
MDRSGSAASDEVTEPVSAIVPQPAARMTAIRRSFRGFDGPCSTLSRRSPRRGTATALQPDQPLTARPAISAPDRDGMHASRQGDLGPEGTAVTEDEQ